MVEANRFSKTALPADRVEHAKTRCVGSKKSTSTESAPGKAIDRRKNADLSTVRERIVNEICRPTLIEQRCRLHVLAARH